MTGKQDSQDEDGRPDWVDETARLTRVAVSGDDEARKKRDDLAAERGYEARVRDDGTLVLHPDDWLDEDGVVDMEAFDADEAYEVPLNGGGFEEARRKNEALLDEFEGEGVGEAEVFNARAFAEFCENHHAVAVENVCEEHVEEFLNDYYIRNVWADEDAEERVEESLRALLEAADRDDLVQATK
ncbi:MAG: DUF7108 family protein [Halobacteria archaeon]